jgi:uncharacterized membrane protein
VVSTFAWEGGRGSLIFFFSFFFFVLDAAHRQETSERERERGASVFKEGLKKGEED